MGGKTISMLKLRLFFVFIFVGSWNHQKTLGCQVCWGLEWCWMSHQLFHQSHARGKLGGGSTSCLVGSVFFAGTSTTRPWKCSMWRWSNEPKNKETGIALVDRRNLYFAVSKCVFFYKRVILRYLQGFPTDSSLTILFSHDPLSRLESRWACDGPLPNRSSSSLAFFLITQFFGCPVRS